MKISRVLSTTALVVAITISTAQVALAEQSTRWEGTGDKWRVRTEDGSGYLQNQWFHDLDNSWYMLGNDSYMYAGIITDPSTGASYYLDTRHEGHYGRMVVENGTYNLNGKQVALTFNNTNPLDATYGAIVFGLSELREAGIPETQKGTQQAETTSQGTQTDNCSNGGSSSTESNQNSSSSERKSNFRHITGFGDNAPSLKN